MGRPDKSVKGPFSCVIVLSTQERCGVLFPRGESLWGFFLPRAGTIDNCGHHQFITAKYKQFVKWKGKWHAWNYSRERDQMNNLAEGMPFIY